MMKRVDQWKRKLSIAVASATALLCAGCYTEEYHEKTNGELSGKDTVQLKLDFRLKSIESKTNEGSLADDRLIKDVNLYVVDDIGDLVYSSYYKSFEKVELEANSNMYYTVYAIANAGKRLSAGCAEEIEELTHSITDITGIKSSEGTFLMSGKSEPHLLEDGECTITVYLTRCAAKVCLQADYSELYEDVEITVKSVQLKNVPSTINIFKPSKIKTGTASMDGETIYNPSKEELSRGLIFHQLENMQGTLQPENTSQQQKQWPEGSLFSKICSYVEMSATYNSPRKCGEILYRFYLGNDMLSNYDVQRNTQLNITVYFTKDGAVDENTWRVDNSEITDILPPEEPEQPEIPDTPEQPDEPQEPEIPQEPQEPETPQEPEQPELPDNSKITFAQSHAQMYDRQQITLAFAEIDTDGKTISATSSNNGTVKILSASEDGISVEALSEGTAVICAQVGDKTTECTITVEKLRIVLSQNQHDTWNHFYTELDYTIYPAYAASHFAVEFISDDEEIKGGIDGIGKRIIPQISDESALPHTYAVALRLQGRPDVAAQGELTVKPMLQLASGMRINANLGNSNVVKDLKTETHPRGNVTFSWIPTDGETLYGNPGEDNVEISEEQNTITFNIPNSANGLYRLAATVTGDDRYTATKCCDIEIYETIYLVGISKTVGRDKVEGEPHTWRYENEIVGKWLSHPNSYMYPQGEVDLQLGFKYNGVTYTDNYTGATEEFTFSFELGETLPSALDKEGIKYNGTPPPYYLEYFALSPIGSNYVKGDLATGKPYLYIFSRTFFSGFSKSATPDWETIFELIYPQ